MDPKNVPVYVSSLTLSLSHVVLLPMKEISEIHRTSLNLYHIDNRREDTELPLKGPGSLILVPRTELKERTDIPFV